MLIKFVTIKYKKMKKLISLSILLFVACLAVFCQVDSIPGSAVIASTLGIPIQWIVYISAAIVWLIGHFAIPKKLASLTVWLEKILSLVITLLTGLLTAIKWFNDKTNNTGQIKPNDVVPGDPGHTK